MYNSKLYGAVTEQYGSRAMSTVHTVTETDYTIGYSKDFTNMQQHEKIRSRST